MKDRRLIMAGMGILAIGAGFALRGIEHGAGAAGRSGTLKRTLARPVVGSLVKLVAGIVVVAMLSYAALLVIAELGIG